MLDEKTSRIVISRDVRFSPQDELCIDDKTEPAVVENIIEFPLEYEQDNSQKLVENEVLDGNVEMEQDLSIYEDADFEDINEENESIQEESVRRSNRISKGIPPQRFQVGGPVRQATEPGLYQEAVGCEEREYWLEAIQDEVKSLKSNGTWEEVELPEGKKEIGCRWIFKQKCDAEGNVLQHKTRLVAQGYKQIYGKDFDEVYAPVAKQVTLRVFLTIAAKKNMLVKHVDVKTAYLYGDLNEQIYMKMPPGIKTATENTVFLLKKSLYGLKQSGRMWNQKIDSMLRRIGFNPGKADACLYVRRRGNESDFILLYVDDLLVACSSEREYEKIVSKLATELELTKLGDVKSYIGLQIEKEGNYYYINHKQYIKQLIEQFGMIDAKASRIPMDPGYIQLKEEKDKLDNNDKFQRLVGGLLYLAVCSSCSQFLEDV